MTTQTKTAPLALHVPEHFTYVDHGFQYACDWVKHIVQPGLYPIHFTTIDGRRLAGNTRDEARELERARIAALPYRVADGTWGMPYYGVATLTTTKVESYFGRSTEQHDEPDTISWRPYAYAVRPDVGAFLEWVGEGKARKLLTHATVVELVDCTECGAEARRRCEPGCQGEWDGIAYDAAPNAGSAP